jgi:hypothetical protein
MLDDFLPESPVDRIEKKPAEIVGFVSEAALPEPAEKPSIRVRSSWPAIPLILILLLFFLLFLVVLGNRHVFGEVLAPNGYDGRPGSRSVVLFNLHLELAAAGPRF